MSTLKRRHSNALGAAIEEAIKLFVREVNEIARKLKKTKFAIGSPMLRPAHPCYTANYDKMVEWNNKKLLELNLVNVTVVEKLSGLLQEFESDGIHLTKSSASNCMEFVFELADEFFESELVDLDL